MNSHCHNIIAELLPRLRRFAYGLTGSADSADDLVQEACERALRDPERWSGADYLDRWLFRSIRNLHVDQVRHRHVVERHASREQHISTAAVDGEQAFENLVTLGEVEKAISCLKEEQRVPLLLISVEGFSYKEAAEILDLPIGTVTSRLARARTQMLDILATRGGRSTSREVNIDG
ncbi:MAG: RNA polymerase sigma factor [Sedimenticola sp.]